MAGYASVAEVLETIEGVLSLHIASPISGTTYSCNIAYNASGGQLASQVLQFLSPEQAFHLHLLYGGKQVDLEQTMSGNGIVDGSEVYFLCKPATPEEVRAIQGKAAGGEELTITEQLLWQTLPALHLWCVREPPNLAWPTCLRELTLDLSECTNLRNLGCMSSLALCTKLQKLFLDCPRLEKASTLSRTSILGAFKAS